jgi:hypothetical protein
MRHSGRLPSGFVGNGPAYRQAPRALEDGME